MPMRVIRYVKKPRPSTRAAAIHQTFSVRENRGMMTARNRPAA